MTQRLALHHILTTQLAKNWETEDSAMARLATNTGRRADTKKIRASLRSIHVPARYHAMMPDTRKTYDSMVEKIHQTMQSVRSKRKPLPAVPLPDAEPPAGSPTVAPPLPSTLVPKNYSKRSRTSRVKGGGHQSKANASTTKSNLKPLALIRAGLSLKAQRARSGGGEVRSLKGFALQKQMNEVIRQKNVLESMLMQHKRLQKDRQTIAVDMQRMRADLDRIVNKLDTSLQSLKSTRTLSSTAPKAKGFKQAKGTIVKKNTHGAVVRRKVKTNSVPMNRQSALANKARSGGLQASGVNFKAKTNPVQMSRQRLRAH